MDGVVGLRHPVAPTVLGQRDAGRGRRHQNDVQAGEHGARRYLEEGTAPLVPPPPTRDHRHSPRWLQPRMSFKVRERASPIFCQPISRPLGHFAEATLQI